MDWLAPKMATFPPNRVSNWWDDINDSTPWQSGVFGALSLLYSLIASISLVQVVRIQCRIPEYGWTMQKAFFCLNFWVTGVRSIEFAFRRQMQQMIKPEVFLHVLLGLPSLGFFTTYALFVLFYAQIYYQVRLESDCVPRLRFYAINAGVYFVQVVLWLLFWWKPMKLVLILSRIFFSVVCLFASLGFLLYGGRIYLMLRHFPIESAGKRKKLKEVGHVTIICFSCFLLRFIMVDIIAFDKAADIDVMNHPFLSFIYYSLVEVLPSTLVLYIFRGTPKQERRRQGTAYHLIV